MKSMISRVVELLKERVMLLSFDPPAFLPLFVLLFFLYKWQFTSPSRQKNIPPSPPKLPFIGNLHQLRGSNPHHSLRALSQRYGDLMFLQLGTKPTVVVSSKEMASMVLKTFDSSSLGRPEVSIAKRVFYGKDMLFAPCGERWKQLRSICMLNLLSSRRVRSFRSVREEEVALMMEKLKKSSVVNLSQTFFLLSNHIICRAAFGRVYDGEGCDDVDKLVGDTVTSVGTKNIENYLPWMGWINWINGVNANLRMISKRFDDVFERIIQEHKHEDGVKQSHGNSDENQTSMKDFVDILLECQRNNVIKSFDLDKDTIKGVILPGHIYTGHSTLEWTFTELLSHPRVMKKLQEEVRGVMGGKQVVTEEDIEKMAYMKAVIKEILRFHPPVQIPIPREYTEEVKINGYDIPVGTQIFINLWAISRDPAHWEEPDEFTPERFLDSPIDFKGQHFEFIPFGSGRRICPGIAFSVATIELALANLVFHFDWSLPKGRESESIDTSETKGSIASKKMPLIAVATPWMAE